MPFDIVQRFKDFVELFSPGRAERKRRREEEVGDGGDLFDEAGDTQQPPTHKARGEHCTSQISHVKPTVLSQNGVARSQPQQLSSGPPAQPSAHAAPHSRPSARAPSIPHGTADDAAAPLRALRSPLTNRHPGSSLKLKHHTRRWVPSTPAAPNTTPERRQLIPDLTPGPRPAAPATPASVLPFALPNPHARRPHNQPLPMLPGSWAAPITQQQQRQQQQQPGPSQHAPRPSLLSAARRGIRSRIRGIHQAPAAARTPAYGGQPFLTTLHGFSVMAQRGPASAVEEAAAYRELVQQQQQQRQQQLQQPLPTPGPVERVDLRTPEEQQEDAETQSIRAESAARLAKIVSLVGGQLARNSIGDAKQQEREAQLQRETVVEAEAALLQRQLSQARAGPQQLPPQPPQAPHGRDAAVKPQQQQARRQQQQQRPARPPPPVRSPPPDEEDDDVIVLSSDDDEGGEEGGYEVGRQGGEYVNGRAEEYDEDEEEEGADEDEEEEEEEGDEGEGEEQDQAQEQLGDLELDGDARWGVTQSQMTRYQKAVAGQGAPSEVLTVHQRSNLELTRKDLASLQPGVWLNDEVVNMYMALLQDRDTRLRATGTAPKCHFFNTFFINKLYVDERAYKYKNVSRWTGEAKLRRAGQASKCVLECDRIIVPVHQPHHWVCAVIDVAAKKVIYYDSMGGRDTMLTGHLLAWVRDEAADKLQQQWDMEEWRVAYPSAIPRQYNGCDCGVFTAMYAHWAALGDALPFRQSQMNRIRAHMTLSLLDRRVD